MFVDDKKNRWFTYKPNSNQFTRISRGMIETFIKCPKCFYLQKTQGVKPSIIPFNLNIAVDLLLKKEFDYYRKIQKPHPVIKKYNLNLVPFYHPQFTTWRADEEGNYYGYGFEHNPTKIEVCGQIDDIWTDNNETLFMVDYKSTSTDQDYKLTMDYHYNKGYKRQLEVYQWIFRMNGFKVSNTAFIVFANANSNNDIFDNKLEFDISLVELNGDDSWVENTIYEIKKILDKTELPQNSIDCENCKYFYNRALKEKNFLLQGNNADLDFTI